MKRYFFLILLLSFVGIGKIYGNWQRTVTNYSRRAYNASNQNWMVDQQRNGWMYFANNKGLLEFDGKEWNTYPINNAKLRSLCFDLNRIYVGGLSQFGYFVPDNKGNLKYTCLSERLKNQKVGNIWNITKINHRIYFQSDYALFCLENNRLSMVPCPHGSVSIAYLYSRLYIVSASGIEALVGNTVRMLVPFGNLIKSKIVKLLPFNGKIMIVSSTEGLFILDNNRIYPFRHPFNTVVKSNQLFSADINSKRLAIGTVQSGVYIYRFDNNSIEHLSIENGLQNKTVLSMKFDQQDNLWLGLDNGIDCIHLNSSYFFLNSSRSAIGAGYSSCLYNGKLYFGTNQGVYKAVAAFTPNSDMKLEFVSGTEGQNWSIAELGHCLFCCGTNSFVVIDGNRIRRIPGMRGVWSIRQINSDHAILGSYFGLYLLQKKGDAWTDVYKIKNGEYSSKTLYLENVSDETIIWTANKENGLYRLVLSKDLKSVIKSKNYNGKFLPKGNNVYVDRVNGELIICSRQGLFYYDEIKDRLYRATKLERQLGGHGAYTYIKEDDQKDIWYVKNDMLKLSIYNSRKNAYDRSIEEYRLRNCLIPDFENITVVKEQLALVGTEDGFSLIKYKNHPQTYSNRLQIRKVYLVNGSEVLYGKSYSWAPSSIVIKYEDNSVGFKFSLTNYKSLTPSLFSCRLIGPTHTSWSPYSNIGFKEYSNLSEGNYIFQVRSFSDSNGKMLVDSISFVILPPWYRTWWAYTFYLLLILSAVWYVFYRFKSKMNEQEQVFKKETMLKDQRIDILEEEKLQAELKYKSDELIRSTLNVVRKNEILREIKKEAVNMSQAIKDKSPVELKRMAIRLISQIDNNIEHDNDLEKFQEAFDDVNKDFFKLLCDRYPDLSKKEKILCVYIKMDLLSKEIAPLLNVSVRGVEIGRYRLRKKLNLGERSNLTEFLQNLK